MSREELAGRLIEILKKATDEVADWDSITGASSIETLGIDSLTTLDLLFYIKEEFGVEVEAEELTGLTTFGDMTEFIEKRLSDS